MSSNTSFQLRMGSTVHSLPLWILLKYLNISFQSISSDQTAFVDTTQNVEIKHILATFEFLSDKNHAIWPTDTKKRIECRQVTYELERIFQLLAAANVHDIPEILKAVQEALLVWKHLRSESQSGFLFNEFTAADAISSGIVLLFQQLNVSRAIGTLAEPVKGYVDKLSQHSLFREWSLSNHSLDIPFCAPNLRALLSADQVVHILLASTSAFKIDAANRGFKGIFPSFQVNVLPVKADSEINSQPVGCEETFRGSLNRLNNAKKMQMQQKGTMTGVDFVLSIENGIVESSPGVWVDLAYVLVEHIPSKQLSVATSAGVAFPTSFVDQARNMGFQKYTVGSMMAKAANNQEANSMDEANPHSYLTGQLKSRSQLLEEAIQVAVGQLTAKTIPGPQ